MKTKTALQLSILGVMLSLVLGIQPVNAQNEPVLTGSALKSEDAAAKADAVFVGQITELGLPTPASTGVVSYGSVPVKVLQVLRGSVDAQTSVAVDVLAWNHEESPKIGSTYIFFAHKNNEKGWPPFTVRKILPATDTSGVSLN